jgi:hypothetical protein
VFATWDGRTILKIFQQDVLILMSATKASDRLANVVAMPFVPTHKVATLVHASLVTPEIPT